MEGLSVYTDPYIWERFLLCSRRVREIPNWNPCVPEAHLLRHLLNRNNGTTFLPNLRTIGWTETVYTHGLLAVLSPPLLKGLDYSVKTGTPLETVKDFMVKLGKRDAHLSRLTVTDYDSNFFVFDLPFLTTFRNIRSVELRGQERLNPPSLKKLCPLVHLEHFLGAVTGFEDCEDTFELPSLRSFHIFDTCASLAGLLAGIRAPLIQDLELGVQETVRQYNPPALFALIRQAATALFAEHLCCFHLSAEQTFSTGAGGTSDIDVVPLRELLEPLLALPQVRALKVRYHWKATLDDSDIHAFAEAWPELAEMTIDLLRNCGAYPSPVALVHLARYCPKLKSLCLPLDIEDPLAVPERTHVSDHGLRSLVVRVRWWEVEAAPAEELARMVDVLFPGLELAKCNRNHLLPLVRLHGEWEAMWHEIEEMQRRRRQGPEV